MIGKHKILLIEDDSDKRDEFHSCMAEYPKYEIWGETGSETDGIAFLKKDDIDIVILDLELEEGNGIHLAEEMRRLPIRKPFIIVTTNIVSTSVFHYLHYELEVDYIYQKSNTSYSAKSVMGIIESIFKYHHIENPSGVEENEQIRSFIYQELTHIGFSKSHIGTTYLVACFAYIYKNNINDLKMTKILYPSIANEFNVEPASVERAIRLSIEGAWNTSGLFSLYQNYPYEVTNKNGRPSNGEFILNMSKKIFGQ